MRSVPSCRAFSSLEGCLDFLQTNFARRIVPLDTKKDHDGILVPRRCSGPQYLFRGEDDLYPDTVSALSRLERSSDLDQEDREQIQNLTTAVIKWFSSPESRFELAEHGAEGLVQHLGLPTRYIDFSADLQVAAAFAVGGRERTSPGSGKICVLEVPKSLQRNAAHIATFCDHQWCERARQQSAFGYAPLHFPDLKSRQAVKKGTLQWFEFPISVSDIERLAGRHQTLVETALDPVAGLLRWCINLYVADVGKLRPRAAEWLVKKVPMVPLVARVGTFCGRSEGMDFLPPCEHVTWDEDLERRCSLLYWSAGSHVKLCRTFLHSGQPNEQRILVFRATHHPQGGLSGSATGLLSGS